MTNKLSFAGLNDIKCTHTIHLPEHIPLSDIEICSVIGNLFDNAVESCKKITDTKNRYINFQVKPFNHMLSMTIENSSDGIHSIDKNGKLQSSKTVTQNESMYHGLGLRRVEEIIENHNGFIDIIPEKEFFQITILIPL